MVCSVIVRCSSDSGSGDAHGVADLRLREPGDMPEHDGRPLSNGELPHEQPRLVARRGYGRGRARREGHPLAFAHLLRQRAPGGVHGHAVDPAVGRPHRLHALPLAERLLERGVDRVLGHAATADGAQHGLEQARMGRPVPVHEGVGARSHHP
jgi:hypothetical protein